MHLVAECSKIARHHSVPFGVQCSKEYWYTKKEIKSRKHIPDLEPEVYISI